MKSRDATNADDTPKPRRRWPTYSLRGMFALMFLGDLERGNGSRF
ncbi:MAG: hypothetical protein N2C14_27605 [Planctomycetales bacterium]